MFSNELAKKLINLPKEIDGGFTTINLNDQKTRIYLKNRDEPEYYFLWEVSSNKKISFKVSLHTQEDNTKEGLVRIDYKGGHKNPETVTYAIPDILKPYIGYWFSNEPHIHIYVEGYKDLAWAAPLSVYNFPILDINSYDDFADALSSFSKEINITSRFNVQKPLI